LIYTTWDEDSDTPNLYTLPIGSSKASSWEMPEGTWGKNLGHKPHMRQPCIFVLSKRSKHSADLYIPDNKMGVIYQVNIEEIK